MTDKEKEILEKLKSIHREMEELTIINDAGGKKLWRRAWQLTNEVINIIQFNEINP